LRRAFTIGTDLIEVRTGRAKATPEEKLEARAAEAARIFQCTPYPAWSEDNEARSNITNA